MGNLEDIFREIDKYFERSLSDKDIRYIANYIVRTCENSKTEEEGYRIIKYVFDKLNINDKNYIKIMNNLAGIVVQRIIKTFLDEANMVYHLQEEIKRRELKSRLN
ncbi:MAG: hypothetical protein QXI33_01285 [Candidatus Pacearchaeota archaeon]